MFNGGLYHDREYHFSYLYLQSLNQEKHPCYATQYVQRHLTHLPKANPRAQCLLRRLGKEKEASSMNIGDT